MTVNRTSGLLISSYSFYLYEIVLFKWIQYEQLSLSNLSISLICLWLLPPSFFAYQRRSKWKGNNRLNIDTILRADIVSTLKFLIKGREGVNCNFGTFITHFNLWILWILYAYAYSNSNSNWFPCSDQFFVKFVQTASLKKVLLLPNWFYCIVGKCFYHVTKEMILG